MMPSFTVLYTSRAGQAGGGGKFQRKNLPIESRRAIHQLDAQTEVFVCTSLRPFRLVLAFWWWLVAFPQCRCW